MDYTSRKRGGDSKQQLPQRDRAAHAENLSKQFDSAWQTALQQRPSAEGVLLEFESPLGSELAIQSLENKRAGIRLLNTQKVDTAEAGSSPKYERATVYVPKKQKDYFPNKVKEYSSKDTKRGKPKNQPLVAGTEKIQLASMESLWTDAPSKLPTSEPRWVEVWLDISESSSNPQDGVGQFLKTAQQNNILTIQEDKILKFPERWVVALYVNREGLETLLNSTDVRVAELRAVREPCTFFVDLQNYEQVEWVQELCKRTKYDEGSNISICILDTGINRGHPLIAPALAASDLHAVNPDWRTDDHEGHGTQMAGLAIYGDLQQALEGSDALHVCHKIESVKILPPYGQNAQEHYGPITASGVFLAEIQEPKRKRVVCMAVTSTETRDKGRPTSWSAELDQLAMGGDLTQRLILVSAGNIRDKQWWLKYPESNQKEKECQIHDPAQSWNAVSVGAYTEKTSIAHSDFQDYTPLAKAGELSPYSTTSCGWEARLPIKPEVVFEGGNVARTPSNNACDQPTDLQLLSIHRNPTIAHLTPFNATSAATAQAAHFAASIYAKYPDIWPETVRGLLVHSARWKDAMTRQFLVNKKKSSYKNLLRSCGYGGPDLEIALSCLKNRLTLVREATLQPFKKIGNEIKTNEMHLYELPWPKEALQELGSKQVKLRVTLSYFVEPDPSKRGGDHYTYASHALGFQLNSSTENKEEFLQRINKEANKTDISRTSTASPSSFWLLGEQLRDVGSLHSDVWQGTATKLANSNLIAVYPKAGWWSKNSSLKKWNQLARYSLIVSIETPETDVDIYTSVANVINTPSRTPIQMVIDI